MIFSPSPFQAFTLKNHPIYIKRDDLISPCYSGNKIRKLHALFAMNLPEQIVSYGGYQSNAMLSIACFAQEKGVMFTYISKPVPEWIHALGEGNLHHALEKGMQLREVIHADYAATIQNLRQTYPDALVIDQGAADPMARPGIARLADELLQDWETLGLKNPAVLLPSGTGTTALYLALALPEYIPVYTTACVGDAAYLKEQWRRLEPHAARYPEILATQRKFHFAKPYPELWESWLEAHRMGLALDLIYAPVAWRALSEHPQLQHDYDLTYIHTGGVLGNATQLERYRHDLGLSLSPPRG